MAFNTSNNNSRDAVNVNTRGMQFMNSDGFQPSTLLFGFWNDMVSIKMHPALDKDQQSDSKKFNYDEVVSTAITLEKASTLLSKIESDILPTYGEPKDIFRGIPVGGDSLFGVGLKQMSDESSVAYVAIFKALDETTKKPEVAMYYELKSGYTVDDYNPENGQFQVTQNIPSELMLFTAGLRAAIQALSNANTHATRTVDKFFRDRMMNQLEEIGVKVGVAPKQKGSWGGGNGGGYKAKDVFGKGSGGFGGGSQQSSGTPDFDNTNAQVTSLKNIDDIEQFMA